MKTVAIIAALVGSTSAFAPAPKVASSTAIQGSVFDDYVGAVDFRGGEMKFDPVSSVQWTKLNFDECTFISSLSGIFNYENCLGVHLCCFESFF